MKHTTITLAVAAALCAAGGIAPAQETEIDTTQQVATGETDSQESQTQAGQTQTSGQATEVVPMVPTGPPVVPVAPVGPPAVPVAPLEQVRPHVETVTLDTDQGPVVVISYPGTVPASEYNIDFTALDTNDDGFVARQEAEAMKGRSGATQNLVLEFAVADKNSDGKLAFTEIIQWVH